MSQSSAGIAIIGGGLSGLTAAMLLEQQGVRDVVLFEARQTLGGRILSVDAAGAVVDAREPALDRFDLGPSWFWPGLQPQLDRLVDELGPLELVRGEGWQAALETLAQGGYRLALVVVRPELLDVLPAAWHIQRVVDLDCQPAGD